MNLEEVKKWRNDIASGLLGEISKWRIDWLISEVERLQGGVVLRCTSPYPGDPPCRGMFNVAKECAEIAENFVKKAPDYGMVGNCIVEFVCDQINAEIRQRFGVEEGREG